MTLCRTHDLWDGIIYVHNRALKDYMTPLKSMFVSVRRAMLVEGELLTDLNVQLGNKLLLYIRWVMVGGTVLVFDLLRVWY